MAQTVTYINFPGNTRDAMNFYKECFGGELQIMDFKGSPMEGYKPDDKVVHSSLVSGNVRIMASDMVDEADLKSGNNVSIMVDCTSEEEIHRLYSALSAGGNPDHPVQPAFWGGLFGHLVDKFGTIWLLNCSPQAG